MQPLYLSGRALRNIGANSFVLGIGKNVSIQNLRQVVQNTQDVFLVQTFEGLASVRPQLAYEVIQRTVGKSLYASIIDSSYILSHILLINVLRLLRYMKKQRPIIENSLYSHMSDTVKGM